MVTDSAQPFREIFFKSQDGLDLYARDYGGEGLSSADHLPLICLPGLTRNSRDFHELAMILSRGSQRPRRVVTMDMRGRGGSARDPNPANYNILIEAQDVADGCAALGIDKAAFLGTSRGGMILHILAAANRALLGAVILNDVGPALGTAGLKLIQSYLGRRSSFKSLDEAAAALRIVHSEAFPNLSQDNWRWYAQATFRDHGGTLEADCDPAIAAAAAALDLSRPLPEMWEQFDAFKGIPLMTIRGGNSTLLTPEILEKMKQKIPEMQVITVSNQGHAPLLHLDGLPEKIFRFLETV